MVTHVYVYRGRTSYLYEAWSNGQYHSSGELWSDLEDMAVKRAGEWFPGAWVHRGIPYGLPSWLDEK